MCGAERLADIEAIKQLKARYFRLLDAKDWTNWRLLFIDDLTAKIEIAPPSDDNILDVSPHESADDFLVFTRELLRAGVTVHHGYTPEIEITGPDTACGIWAMNDILRFPRLTLHGYGHYHEEYRRTADGWRIAQLRLTRLIVDRVPA